MLSAIALFFILAGAGSQWCKYQLGYDYMRGLVPLFDLDRERNLPTLFSVGLLALAGTLLAVIAVLKRRQADRDARLWALLSFGLFLMSVDESWSFHEQLAPPMRALLGGAGPGNILYYAWIVPGLALIAVVALAYLRFLVRLAPAARKAFLLAACVYFGGALGVEALGGAHAAKHGPLNLTHAMLAAVEEGFEMFGAIMLIHALLTYIVGLYDGIRWRADAVDGE